MNEDTIGPSSHFSEWINLKKAIKEKFPLNEKIISDLGIFYRAIISIIGNSYDTFTSEIITMNILGALSNNKKIPDFGYNFDSLNQLFKNLSISKLEFKYWQLPNKIEYKYPMLYKFLKNETYDAEWFFKHFSQDLIISSELFKILCTNNSIEELQGILFDFLGPERIELIFELIQRKTTILEQILFLFEKRSNFINSKEAVDRSRPATSISFNNSFVQSSLKKQKKTNRKENDIFVKKYLCLNWNFIDKFFEEITSFKESTFTLTPNYKPFYNVYDTEYINTKEFIINNKVYKLPAATSVIKYPTYEEYCIPANLRTDLFENYEKIPISVLNNLSKRIFEGLKSLNTIQSIIYDKAVNSCENLLICAPTGAGKTNIALLAILRDLIQVDERKLSRKDFRVVYIAPMKALANEIVVKFSKTLSFFDLKILEVTGDTQIPKFEISSAHIIVTTPEKWDILTRKSNNETSYTLKTRILIIDEIHLLQEERGAVLEALVTRAHRTVEENQNSLRLIGLSATLPNYIDVAAFLKVDPTSGLFYFDSSFRPVPLEQQFIGIKSMVNSHQTLKEIDRVCFIKIERFLREKQQVIVFVHSRDSTRKSAFSFIDYINNNNLLHLITSDEIKFFHKKNYNFNSNVLDDLLEYRISIHHAGLSKHDRNNVEKMFTLGHIKVLFSTSTLAWGVNLPAHAVIVKGTSFYDTNKGKFSNIGILDIQQMFGRAGRPQFDTTGCGILITDSTLINNYIGFLVNNNPIESSLLSGLSDFLNAEISLGSISNIEEAINWLSYTFLYIRMIKNPLVYGLTQYELSNDPNLTNYRRQLILDSVKRLDSSKMIRFNISNGFLSSTALGVIGSHYYIKHASIDLFNNFVQSKEILCEAEILFLVSKSSEFEQIKIREDEVPELMYINDHIPFKCKSVKEMDSQRKIMTLLQAHVSNLFLNSPSLASDMMYISQNIGRLLRGYYEICVYHGFPVLINKFLNLLKSFELKIWFYEHPFSQFSHIFNLNTTSIKKIKNLSFTIDRLVDFTESEISIALQNNSLGPIVKKIMKSFPVFEINVKLQTLTRSVLQLTLTLTPKFIWNNQIMTYGSEDWVLWIEDYDTHYVTYYDQIKIPFNKVNLNEPIVEIFTIPIFEPLPIQYIIKLVSMKFLGAEYEYLLNTKNLCLPEVYCAFTKLLPLQPIPISALKNSLFEKIYNFKYFNPIQTQAFHSCYNSDVNILLGAPTGSGKTIIAEFTILRLFSKFPSSKVVYISPMKALVKERKEDWIKRMNTVLGKNVVELTGDVNPDLKSLLRSDIILTTPEKWDGITRSWKDRIYVKNVQLVIIDEVHLLGGDRGHILEAIVSRIRMIVNETGRPIRIIALSTSVSNSLDLAKWLNVPTQGVFNFDPSVRLVPLQAHILGFPTKHYCPRMESMNKTVYLSIKNYSFDKPVLVFTSSRRQTRRTAEALLTLSLAFDKSEKWCNITKKEIDLIISQFSDTSLKNLIPYGIGIHHAGLIEKDRRVVEELFLSNKIQILIATSTLAWGVNFPAHLVIIKGTEYHDVKTHSYIDFPITDILQMIGRAGRPQFDTSGVGVILVHQPKKHFYKRFLYEPFPVESSFLSGLSEHINAEIVSGFIKCYDDAFNYLKFSYFFRRLSRNPTFYNLSSTKPEILESFLNDIITKSFEELYISECIIEVQGFIQPSYLGVLASQYYISHKTMRIFASKITRNCTIQDLLTILSFSTEFEKVPVRHNEDEYNENLAKVLPLKIYTNDYSSPFVKVFLLLQAFIGRYDLPIKDYYSDTKSILDQAIRILQAIINFCINKAFLKTTLQCLILLQSIIQGCWWHKSSLFCIPKVDISNYDKIQELLSLGLQNKVETIAQLTDTDDHQLNTIKEYINSWFGNEIASKISNFISSLPRLDYSMYISNSKKSISIQLNQDIVGINQTEFIKLKFNIKNKLICCINMSILRGDNSDKISYSRVSKDVDNSWVVLLGEKDIDKIISSKRISAVSNHAKTSLFIGPWCQREIGKKIILTVFLISESIYGLDQQYDIPIQIVESSDEY